MRNLWGARRVAMGLAFMAWAVPALMILAVPALVGWAVPARGAEWRDLGIVAVYPPKGEIRSIALMISGAQGWDRGMDDRARLLAGLNTLAVGIDARALVADPCLSVARILTRASHRLHRTYLPQGRIAPTLVGWGLGAQMGFAALAQMTPGSFKGLVSHGFDPAVAGRAYCAEGGLRVQGGALAIPAKAPALWTDLGPTHAVTARPGLRLLQPDPGARPEAADAAFAEAYLRIAGSDAAMRADPGAVPPDLADLPLTVVADPAAPHRDLMAVFVSGDGGWAPFDAQLAERLAAAGVPVVGVSALRYFWAERLPDRIAADMARVIGHYSAAWDRDRVVLIGFSFGANVTPFYAAELPGAVRDQVAGLALLSPERQTGFEFQVGGWLGLAGGRHDVGAAIAAVGLPMLCAYDPAADSPCAGPGWPHVQGLALGGGHHLGGAYDRITAAVLALAAAPQPLAPHLAVR